ncbi:amidase domain-containing protein [Nocardia iowensis]|uniref:Amidase domain-containing protein n=1 Tax=Nocardia iowensis TaxID=204891 RepID=A0ABX8RLP3_NOCIO|nr:amidase domain-containing protein [Nocardia iowensis]QXN90535.1 amidase domain-containing protein [Nocardia iowensis]
MATFAELRDAKPDLWQSAADDLLAISKQTERTADNIHANGVKPLEDSWPDKTGSLARGVLTRVANRMVNASIMSRGAMSALDVLQDAVAIAQRQLSAAVNYATAAQLSVDANGRVVIPPDIPFEPSLYISQMNAQRMIDDAIEAATQADQACVEAIAAVSVDPDDVTKAQAQAHQSTAVHKALEALRNTLPDGLSPMQVREWWQSLTPQQQKDLMRAVPVELAKLDGIPEDVKKSLRDDGRGYDPVNAVSWALAHANDTGIDVFNNNCANFASHALRAGGLKDKMDFWSWGTLDSDNWGTSPAGDVGVPFIEGKTHTESWYNSDSQRKFFLENGGTQVSVSDARPGDIVYFDYNDGPGGHPDGVSHHTAIVTAVMPDGEVLYTQHTPGASNQSLQNRLPMVEQGEGRQNITVVRPKETW